MTMPVARIPVKSGEKLIPGNGSCACCSVVEYQGSQDRQTVRDHVCRSQDRWQKFSLPNCRAAQRNVRGFAVMRPL